MRGLPITFFILFNIVKIYAQPGLNIKSNLIDSASHVSENLYNGVEYIGYPSSIEGHAYLLSDDWRMGTIVYRNVVYENVFLKFDLVKDQVIIRHYNGFTAIALFSPRVQSFRFDNHRFIFLPGNNILAEGFYEELAKGQVSLLASRSKVLQENINSGKVEQRFHQGNSYFVLKDSVYYPVKKEKSLLALLANKKAELKTFLKANKIRYKDDPENTFITIVEYYNQLSK